MLDERGAAARALLLRVRLFTANPRSDSLEHPDSRKRFARRRQKAICFSEDDSYDRYKALFHSPSASELEQQFASIVGDSYESLPPSLMAAFKSVDTSDSGYNEAAQRICDSSLLDSMTLDQARAARCACVFGARQLGARRWQLILSCIFHHIESFCKFLHLNNMLTRIGVR